MYKITLTLSNPITDDSETMTYQFDPPTLTQNKWNGGYTALKARLDALVARSAAAEPPTW